MMFLERSEHLQGLPFDRYVGDIASRALVGPTTAGRLAVFGTELLTEQTINDLGLIADGTIKPSLPETPGYREEDPVAPLVRRYHDFEPGDEVFYYAPEQASHWSHGNVDIGKLVPVDMSKDTVLATGPLESETDPEFDQTELETDFVVFVNSQGFNGFHFSPSWPGLLTKDLHDRIMSRKRSKTKETSHRTWRAFGTALTKLSYFDPQVENPIFLTAITSTLRHFDTPTKD